MLQRLWHGLTRGFIFGLVYIWAETFWVYFMSLVQMELAWSPYNAATLHLSLLTLAMITGFGGILGLVAGSYLDRKPVRYVHALAACMLLTNIVVSPVFDQIFAMTLFVISFAYGTLYFIGRLPTRLQRLAPLAMIAFWLIGQSVGRHHVDDAPPQASGTQVTKDAPNVLWIVLDTTRVDHLSVYGYGRQTTPVLEGLARDGAVFEQAYSTAPWTLASHAAMFTGMYSKQHNCTHAHKYLDPEHTTLAEVMAGAGYETAMFAGNPWLGPHTGLTRGIQYLLPSWQGYNLGVLFAMGRLQNLIHRDTQDKGGRESVHGFNSWLAHRSDDKPFFAFFNFLEPHAPYHDLPVDEAMQFLPKTVSTADERAASFKFGLKMMMANDYEATQTEREVVEAVYDGGIHYSDKLIGQVLESLKAAGKLDNTLIIVNADHGEMFGEHGIYGHDLALYNPLLHVPLIVTMPGKVPAGQRYKAPVQLIDVFPTVLELTGQEARLPKAVVGQSLTALFVGGGTPGAAVPATGATDGAAVPATGAGTEGPAGAIPATDTGTDASAAATPGGATPGAAAPGAADAGGATPGAAAPGAAAPAADASPAVDTADHTRIGDPKRPIFAEYYPSKIRPLKLEIKKMGYDPKTFLLRSVHVENEHLIRGPVVEKESLYDMGNDPEETKDLIQERPQSAKALGKILTDFTPRNQP